MHGVKMGKAPPEMDLESVGLMNDVESHDENGIKAEDFEIEEPSTPLPPKPKRGKRFWAVMVALQLCTLIVATETNVAATALPSIMADFQDTSLFDWVLNSYNLMSTVVQPPMGQFSDIFGRKPVIMGGLLTYMIGSALSGAAASPVILIVGRTIQGAGGGVLLVLSELIISDMVPLNERAGYLGALMAINGLGLVVGPLFGGLITEKLSWRWIYYLNVPAGVVAMIVFQLGLTMNHRRETTWREGVAKIEFVGITLFIASTAVILIGLSSTEPQIVAIIIGCVGMVLFVLHQNSRWCREPLMPRRLLNLTTTSALSINFLLSMVQLALPYFFGVYLQALLQHSPAQSGTDLIALFLTFLPFAGVSGAIISKTGRYQLVHVASMGFVCLAMAGCMELDENSQTYVWVLVLCTAAIGMGLGVPSLLPAAQAPLPDSDSATVTATFSFVRSLGFVWGIFIASVLFNHKVDNELWKVSDPAVVSLLQHGGAYSHATATFMNSLSETIRAQVVMVYDAGLRVVWEALLASSLLGLVLSFVEKEVTMRKTLDTEYGLK